MELLARAVGNKTTVTLSYISHETLAGPDIGASIPAPVTPSVLILVEED